MNQVIKPHMITGAFIKATPKRYFWTRNMINGNNKVKYKLHKGGLWRLKVLEIIWGVCRPCLGGIYFTLLLQLSKSPAALGDFLCKHCFTGRMKLIRCLSQKGLHLLVIGCFVVFVVQMGFLIYNRIHPSQTVSSTKQTQLADISFPVVFKICIKPAYNMKQVGL